MDRVSRLNPYSRRFAELLVASHPTWLELAVVEPWPNADEATSFSQALEEVAGILAGTRVLFVGFRNGSAAVSQMCDATDRPRLLDVDSVEAYSWPLGRIDVGAMAADTPAGNG